MNTLAFIGAFTLGSVVTLVLLWTFGGVAVLSGLDFEEDDGPPGPPTAA